MQPDQLAPNILEGVFGAWCLDRETAPVDSDRVRQTLTRAVSAIKELQPVQSRFDQIVTCAVDTGIQLVTDQDTT